MLTILEIYKEGFNEKVTIGESVEYQENKYIVIRILEIKKRYFSQSISLAVRVLVQKVGEMSDYLKYKSQGIITERYNQSKDKVPIKAGEISLYQGIAYEIISINSFRYEFVDLIVEYSVRVIVPWSQKEINDALTNERKSTFKVLEGGKG
ncbi:hypothetical protein [Enterococcus mundtii]|uniref:Uncharacterized protein n=1 Tax=Enterococcus mundtii TaxID=53346 RepID=A0A1V2UA04_ENTMU|nr:hypothetical protein [Enterococcus mundtii]ONN40077.1 hypothetical protein BTN92_15810 [Enterococcus mundtii]